MMLLIFCIKSIIPEATTAQPRIIVASNQLHGYPQWLVNQIGNFTAGRTILAIAFPIETRDVVHTFVEDGNLSYGWLPRWYVYATINNGGMLPGYGKETFPDQSTGKICVYRSIGVD